MLIQVDTAGRILLPIQVRRALGIKTGKKIKMELVDNKIILIVLEEDKSE